MVAQLPRAGFALALAATGLLGVVPSAASAAAGGVSYVKEAGTTPPAPQQGFLRADCPPDMHVVGGGVKGAGAHGEHAIQASFPVDGPDGNQTPDDGWAVWMDNLTGSPLKLTVFAICTKGSHAYGINPWLTVSPSSTLTETLDCPGGTHLTSGGAGVDGLVDEAYILRTFPQDDASDQNPNPDDEWNATARNFSSADKHMNVFGICGTGHYAYRRGIELVDPQARGKVRVRCPVDTHLVGGGIDVSQVFLPTFRLNSMYPRKGAGSGHRRDAWVVRVDNFATFNRGLSGYAICKR